MLSVEMHMFDCGSFGTLQVRFSFLSVPLTVFDTADFSTFHFPEFNMYKSVTEECSLYFNILPVRTIPINLL